MDTDKGYWIGTNEFLQQASHQQVQEVAVYSIMENPMTACLTADTEVLVDGRVAPLGDFVERWQQATPAQVTAFDEQSKAAPSQVLGVHKNPAPSELIRVETKSGLKLTLTPNHEVAVDRWDQNGHGPWVRADELRAGDRVYALKQLRIDGKVPDVIDVLPDSCRVIDVDLFDELKTAMQMRFGSLQAAYQILDLDQPDPRVSSIPLATLRKIVTELDMDWAKIKAHITTVAPASGHPQMQLPALTPDLFYLLGLLASDGSLDWRGPGWCRMNFTNCEPDLLDAFATRYAQVFPDAVIWTARQTRRRQDRRASGEFNSGCD